MNCFGFCSSGQINCKLWTARLPCKSSAVMESKEVVTGAIICVWWCYLVSMLQFVMDTNSEENQTVTNYAELDGNHRIIESNSWPSCYFVWYSGNQHTMYDLLMIFVYENHSRIYLTWIRNWQYKWKPFCKAQNYSWQLEPLGYLKHLSQQV